MIFFTVLKGRAFKQMFTYPSSPVSRSEDQANRSHVAAGSWFCKREQMERTIKQGSRLVIFSNDGALLRESLEQSFTQLRKR